MKAIVQMLWLIKMLHEFGCKDIVLVHPAKRTPQTMDYRDANTRGELLWMNRKRLVQGALLQYHQRVMMPSANRMPRTVY
jgi:hypothetical protein